jgi:TolB-like protein/Tfp pilus assembly protein PilF
MAGLDHDALSRLLEQALARPPAAREAFLEEACHGDQELHGELTSLVAANQHASRYFEQLAGDVVRPALLAITHHTNEDLTPGDRVAHYEIIEKLGAGGMGVVFKARDTLLGRLVALKFLPTHLNADAGAKGRFLAEAQAASALDHPNIATVHQLSETEAGRLFIVMACYEGETLDQRTADGRLPVAQALGITQQIASGLAAAHARGIIHRDVKPSNILITPEGTVKLLDFGIAKLAHSNQTGKGGILGTLAYMSPEQIRGTAVDHRTDLWSLGVVLYEMLTGFRPYRAEHDEALIYAIRNDAWEPVTRMNPAVPAAVARVAERCLARNREERYHSAEDLLADLSRIASAPARLSNSRRFLRAIGAAAVAITVGAGALFLIRAGDEATPAVEAHRADRSALAVMPLTASGSDPSQNYVAAAMTTELITRLSNMSALRVTAPSSVLQYVRDGKSIIDVGRDLGVGTLLEGTLEQTDDETRITLHLLDTKNQQRLWSRTYVSPPDGLQSLQQRMAIDAAAALKAEIEPGERSRVSAAGTTSPDAYLLYLKGRHFLDKANPESVMQAREYFQQALDLDPLFAQGWSGLADAYGALGVFSPLPAADVYPRMRAAAARALKIDPTLAEAHVSLGIALSYHYWDFQAAARHYRRAIELSPSYAEAYRYYAEDLRNGGRFDEALEAARKAAELDPLSNHQVEHGIILYMAGRYDEAAAQYERLLAINPNFRHAYFFLALVHVQKREYAAALEALDKAQNAQRQLDLDAIRGYIHAVTGRQDAAREFLDQARLSAWQRAVVHIGLGEHDRAIELLAQAEADRPWEFRMIPVEPLFEPLRNDRRFIALVEKLR